MGLSVLLLEDDPNNKKNLLQFLNRKDNCIDLFDVALCVNDAISKMRVFSYDLLIADVVVPLEYCGDQSEINCINMFEEIDDLHGEIKPPRFSLPISLCAELSDEAVDFFSTRPWSILPYDDSSAECIISIEKIVNYVFNYIKRDVSIRPCDVFIITALYEPEFVAFDSCGIAWEGFEPLDKHHLVRYGTLNNGTKTLVVASAYSSRMGPVPAAILTTKAIEKLNPRMVVMGGICAGIQGKANIGDIIAADLSWDWQSGKYINNFGKEVFEISPHQESISDYSRNQFTLLKRDSSFSSALKIVSEESGFELSPKIVVGPVASGSSVVADERVSSRIKEVQHKNVVGLDMETYAVFSAVKSCGSGVEVISMKSVCDKGDKKKNDKYQMVASLISSRAIVHLLLNFHHDTFV